MALRPVGVRRTNLPAELSSFVGRRGECAEVKRLLQIRRLVTLTGAGGVGKTRLAQRVATALVRSYPDGVWLVELAKLHDPELVGDAVATALGIRVPAGQPALALLCEELAGKRMLLVLDNCEHLLAAAVTLSAELLRRTAHLRILTTCREPLGVAGEAVLAVPPLTVPDPERPLAPDAVAGYEAVTLFTDRAVAVAPGFTLTEDNHVAVASICHRLDGLPLPIELAVVRLRTLSPQQILERLGNSLVLLNRGNPAGPHRQQTLGASIEWSFDLCSPAQRILWRRLAIFAGGFELDAVGDVCGGTDLPGDALPELVSRLVDKSVLLCEDHGHGARYRMLRTIRDFGLEKLREAGEYLTLAGRHRLWCEQLMRRSSAEWIGPRQAHWRARLEREQQNLRTALDFCLTDAGEPAAALRIAVSLPGSYWWTRGPLGEAQYWLYAGPPGALAPSPGLGARKAVLDRALALETEPTVLRARAILLNSALAISQGDLGGATILLAAGRTLAGQLGDRGTLACAAHVTGLAALAGREAGAAAYLENALELLTPSEEDLGPRLATLVALGIAAAAGGDPKRAVACHEEVLALAEPRGECVHRAYSQWALGLAARDRGELGAATALLRASLALTRRLDDRLGAAFCMEALAWILAEDDRHDEAARLLGAAESCWRAETGSAAPDRGYLRHLARDREQCELRILDGIGDKGFQSGLEWGLAVTFEDAVGFALGERPAAAPGHRAPGPPPLTPREQEVAALIRDGLTNKQIATALTISRRTAESHVDKVLTKLGVSSRSQVAALLAERRRSG